MPSYKELVSQGLEGYSGNYPIPARNSEGQLINTYQKIKWTGNFLDAELEHLEYPASCFPSVVTNTPVRTSSPDMFQTTKDSPLGRKLFGPSTTPVVSFPPPPQKDERGLYPSKPKDLPPRPQRDCATHIYENKYGKLVSERRPLTDDEIVSRDSEFLYRLQLWKCWAEKQPREWGLLTPEELKHLDETKAQALAYADSQTNSTNTPAGTICLILLIMCLLSIFYTIPPQVFVLLLAQLAFSLRGTYIDSFLLSFLINSIKASLQSPITTAGTIVYWVMGALGAAVAAIFALLVSCIVEPLAKIFGILRNKESWFWRTLYAIEAFLQDSVDGLGNGVSHLYRMKFWTGISVSMSVYSINEMIEEPVWAIFYTTIVVGLVSLVCLLWPALRSSTGQRPEHVGDMAAFACANCRPPPTTPPKGRSATTSTKFLGSVHDDLFTSPPRPNAPTYHAIMHTPSETQKKCESLLSRALLQEFGTPNRGPFGSGFGALKEPLTYPTFFTTSTPRKVFS